MTEDEIVALAEQLAAESAHKVAAYVERLTGVQLGISAHARFGVLGRSPAPVDLAEEADRLLTGAAAELDQAQAEISNARRKR